MRRVNERLTELIDLGLQLGSERDVRQLLQSFCHAAREIIGARCAAVGVLNGDGSQLRHYMTSGLDAATAARLGTPGPRQAVLGAVLKECRCYRLHDPGGLAVSAAFPPVYSFLGAPIVSPAHVYGWLCLIDKVGAAEFSAEDERLAGVLAAQVGRIYENGSLYADLLRRTAALEQEVAERKRAEETLKVRDEQLRQSAKMEAVGRLAGGVAHDFNNLLTVIIGYGDMLESRLRPGDSARELVREMIVAGHRGAGLTRQLLAFGRKALLDPRVLDLRAVVADMERMLRRIIGEDVQLVAVADSDAGLVKADPSHIEQVILNLAVNARDAMPGGGRLTIEVRNAELDETYTRDHPEARPGPHVMLAVSDTGSGMDAATMSRIWEPFFTTKGEKGTGLGLATVYGIIKQSGGHVAVYSEVGHGTTFKIYLPRVELGAPAGRAQAGTGTMPPGSETVLLVEDEDGVRSLARRILENCGYTILEARDGPEAVRLAGEHQEKIDLLVTDAIMPRMGGREVAERVAPLHPETKVLFLSGYTDDAVVRHGILEAAVEFLQKPFSPQALAVKVRETLDKR